MSNRSHLRAYFALAAVCFFWGTTYLGIRIALEMVPPVVLVSIRYLLSGSLLLGAAFLTKARFPGWREIFFTSLLGIITLGVGNGCLAFAEELIPSGLAAMFVTISPFWMVGLEALLPGGERLHGPTIAGMLVGLCGTVLLVAPSAIAHGFSGPVTQGFLILQLGCFGWSLGSILQRRHETKAHAVLSGAFQQLATGLVYAVPALLLPHAPIHWNPRGISAILYLALFGGIIGYSAYIYSLQNLPVSVVSLYNYVNPIVAVVLGYLFYREQLGWRELLGMAVIFLGVALVKRFSSHGAKGSKTAPVDQETHATA